MLEFLKYLLIAVEVVTCVLLVGVILIQKSKGGGLGAGFGGGMSDSLLGSQAGNFLTRSTVTLSIVFFVVTMALGRIYSDPAGAASIMDGVVAEPTPITAPVPAGAGLPAGGDAGAAQPIDLGGLPPSE